MDDQIDIDTLLSADEIELRDKVRAFVRTRITPNIKDWYERAVFPREIVKEMGDLGLLGMQLAGYGCPGRSAVEYGLAAMELEAGDSGLRTFVSVQGSLAMSAIHKFGSDEQKQRWLPGMARGGLIGCFGLTEPTVGSDPASMQTTARKDGDGSAALQAATLAVLFVAAALPSCLVWLAFGAAVQRVLRSDRAARVFNLVMAALLAASVVLLVT